MKNMKEVHELLSRMMKIESLKKHVGTLTGPRKRGSLTDFGLMDLDGELPLEEFTPAEDVRSEGCRYFRFHAPALYGRLGAVALQVALSRGWTIKERKGSHGPELYRDVSPEACEMPRTDDYTLIIGPDDLSEELVIFTWHPGEVLRSYKNELTARTAVKVHNG